MAVVPLPLPANIKLQYATNISLINSTKEFNRLLERCLELGTHLEDRIVVHDIATAKDLRLNGADLKQKIKPPINATTPGSHRYYTKGTSLPMSMMNSNKYMITSGVLLPCPKRPGGGDTSHLVLLN